eukprot:10095899-Ditylum_brightwellii.AAC.1
MNLAVAEYAPKTKTFSRSISLWNCVPVAIDVQNRGHHYFWTNVYHGLGLFASTTMDEYFIENDAQLLKKRLKAKTPEWRREKAK